jgi:hypothetical protein
MKTDDLIALLATGNAPVARHAVGQRFGLALAMGLPLAALLLALTLGLRHDLRQEISEPIFWTKLAFAASLALAALFTAQRLARPGMRLGGVLSALTVPILVLWLYAALVFVDTEPSQRMALIFGSTWRSCPFNIGMVSLPLLGATLWAMRGLAPTRLALAGAGAGLLSGALGALVYALHCPESAAPFVAVWYVLGIALPTSAGAALGPRVLRW